MVAAVAAPVCGVVMVGLVLIDDTRLEPLPLYGAFTSCWMYGFLQETTVPTAIGTLSGLSNGTAARSILRNF